MVDALRWILSLAAFVGMAALCVIFLDIGGAGGLFGAGLGFLLRFVAKGGDFGERLGNGYVGALMGLALGLMAGALGVYLWPALDAVFSAPN